MNELERKSIMKIIQSTISEFYGKQQQVILTGYLITDGLKHFESVEGDSMSGWFQVDSEDYQHILKMKEGTVVGLMMGTLDPTVLYGKK